jgi:hypothetical protein
MVLVVRPVDARARLIAVFPLRSTPAIAVQASKATQALLTRLSAVDGYDAKVVASPSTGSLGTAAAGIGAEVYVVGQIVLVDGAFQISVGSFRAATDKEIAEYQVSVADPSALPEQPRVASLLQEPAAAAAATSVVQVAANGITLPTGTPVDIHLDAPLSSGSAKVGDKFAFQSNGDIAIDGVVVIAKGAQGEGEVALAEGAGSNGHPGKLGLQFNWIAAVDGSKVALSDTQHSDEGEQKKGAASTATIATYILLGPLGLFAHNFVRGRDITLDEKTKLKAYVDHTVHVASQVKESVPAGFAR